MVFVEKTLDQLLGDIGYKNPIKLKEINKDIPKNRCYFFRDKESINEYNFSVSENLENYIGTFLGIPEEDVTCEVDCCTILELLNNSLDWGNGIKETRYYSSPLGVVVDLIQNKIWDYKKVVKKVKGGIPFSSRASNGGHGLKSANESEIRVSYKNNSTLIMIDK